ncbi:phosphoenolpyruvate carboxylase, partial [Ectothiorhodospira marina]
GSLAVESVAAFPWNGWQACRGISGNLAPEYAYLDPLNHIQIILLRRYRALHAQGEKAEDPWISPLLRSINAIAAGMRNTG